jgi:hypothetical protein
MYRHYNPNPRNPQAGDCVVRALAAVTGRDWLSVYAALSVQGFMMGDWGNSDSVWGEWLRSQGFRREIIPNSCPACYTVADFAADHPHGAYVLGAGSHAVAVVDGDIYDSWDSSGAVPIFFYAR